MQIGRIGVIGYGIVGAATAHLFEDPVIYDPPLGYTDPTPLASCDIIFLSVPVPTVQGKNDLTILHEALDTVTPLLNREQIIAIRSTVVPGTVRGLQARYPNVRFASNPEFLRAHRAAEDARNPYRMVVGADEPGIAERVAAAYRARIGHDVPFILTDTRTAEMIKYSANAYMSLKISYMHEIWDACQTLGVDYDVVRGALALDPRIGDGEADIELQVDPLRLGFDDECLPKDLAAFIGFMTGELGRPGTMIQATAAVNADMLSRRPVAPVAEAATLPLAATD